jgi:hypothetical protein
VLNSFYYLPTQIGKVKETIAEYEQDLQTQQEILKIPVQNFEEEIHQKKKRLSEVNEIILGKVKEEYKTVIEEEIQVENEFAADEDREDEYDNHFDNEDRENEIASEVINDFPIRFRR